ncbi:hypothetical protein KGQ27_01985 [Patescibacteria group bacterium]|nr:hypothetical protein [Patescibacteria group bacterium]MDE1946312.1 hypothetical protein [Patescibacteria group bacterium]MDE2010764.1 hypothetical protein [Patescibacteria group bacterium]MDE2232649.1 hypothetical protein [Patescibacteria group bacterium]
MADTFIVNEEFGGKPLGGTAPSSGGSKWRKYYDTPSKKVGLIIMFVLFVVAVSYFRTTSSGSIGDEDKKRIIGNGKSVVITLTSEPSKIFEIPNDMDWYFRVENGWADEIHVIDLDNHAVDHIVEPGSHFTTSGIKRFQMTAKDIDSAKGPVMIRIWVK